MTAEAAGEGARRLWSIHGNAQRLDGGAMFGNVPRPLWERWIAPDDRHRIPLACRALLIEEAGGRRVLLETGIGAFFPPRLRDRFGVVEAHHVLLDNLAAAGCSAADIDVVVLSHLHFDHAGGLLTAWAEDAAPELCFPTASFVVSRQAWERAINPHPRDRASFVAGLQPLLAASGRLELVEGHTSMALGANYRLRFSDGHTPGLMLVEIPGVAGPIVFAGDLVPGRPWLHAPVTMGYDRFPERLIDEKLELLTELVERDGRLFFTHDPEAALARVTRDERGRFAAGETWTTLEGLEV